MWVRRRTWKALVERVEALENAKVRVPIDGVTELTHWSYRFREIPLQQAVQELARELIFKRGTPDVVFKK
jgi:hypothetical protein